MAGLLWSKCSGKHSQQVIWTQKRHNPLRLDVAQSEHEIFSIIGGTYWKIAYLELYLLYTICINLKTLHVKA